MSAILLYNYFRSSTSFRVRIALHYKGLDFTYMPVHLLNNGGEQNQSAYRSINPSGGVPSLIHNGQTISESRAILEYLEEIFPENPLLPKSAFERAKVKQICDHINTAIHPFGNLKVLQYLEKDLHLSVDQKNAWLQKWIGQGLEALEGILSTSAGTFAVGNSLTLADLFLVPQVVTAHRFGVETKQHTQITRIFNLCSEMECFKKSHPFRQIDTPEDLRID